MSADARAREDAENHAQAKDAVRRGCASRLDGVRISPPNFSACLSTSPDSRCLTCLPSAGDQFHAPHYLIFHIPHLPILTPKFVPKKCAPPSLPSHQKANNFLFVAHLLRAAAVCHNCSWNCSMPLHTDLISTAALLNVDVRIRN
jgi:hypothetical protein